MRLFFQYWSSFCLGWWNGVSSGWFFHYVFWPVLGLLSPILPSAPLFRMARKTEKYSGTSDRTAQPRTDRHAQRTGDKSPIFWSVIIWLMMIPGFIITGIFFHQIHIAQLKMCPYGSGHPIISGMLLLPLGVHLYQAC